MKIKVGYSTSIPIAAYGIKDNAWCEVEVDDGRDFNEVWSELKDKVDKAVKEKYPHLYQPTTITVQYTGEHQPINSVQEDRTERTREETIQAHITTINECKTLRNLEMFANMVQRENSQELFDAYNQKKKELQSLQK